MKNHITQQIMYLISLLVVINLASAITFEELIASYDFNYNDNVVNIDSITHYGNDTDSILGAGSLVARGGTATDTNSGGGVA